MSYGRYARPNYAPRFNGNYGRIGGGNRQANWASANPNMQHINYSPNNQQFNMGGNGLNPLLAFGLSAIALLALLMKGKQTTKQPLQVIAGADGAQGPAGPQGPQGNNGKDGAQGPAGPQGPQGNNGKDGAQGPAGPQGPQGNNGKDGAQGPAGPQGPQGNNGKDGDFKPVIDPAD